MFSRRRAMSLSPMPATSSTFLMAATVFSPYEQAVLRRLPIAQQATAFFNGWTRKEAYIKAHGQGLSMPLADFDVTLAPDEPVRLVATRPDPTEAQRWSLYGWSPAAQWVAALAVAPALVAAHL